MIKGISFEKLDKDKIQKMKEYSEIVSSNFLTRIGNTVVLPNDCMPNLKTARGVLKDPMQKLYSKLKLSFENEDGKFEDIHKNIIDELKTRWYGKNGRWRKDLCGKRTNFTARSVLSPNANLELYQIGLPIQFKKTLLKQDIFENKNCSTTVYILENEKRFDSRFRKPKIGDTILREIKEHELVLVNRQPTLRNSNFVAMHVIWNTMSKTIQMHPGNFSMFDADCDGDELNIHVPQNMTDDYLEAFHIKHSIYDFSNTQLKLNQSVIQDAVVGLCMGGCKTKHDIHTSIHRGNDDTMEHIKNMYEVGLKKAYVSGFSIGFDFSEVDFMVDTGAKGNLNHKTKIREMFRGSYNNTEHIAKCKLARIAMISTSLKTASTGYISRRMSYHLDDVKINHNGTIGEFGFLLSYPCKIPIEFKHLKNIGLQLVSVLIPPLTQKLLDSFHFAAAGEEIQDETKLFDSLVNCSHDRINEIFTEEGIFAVKHWLFNQVEHFFDGFKIDLFWIQLLIDFLTVTGRPIGIDLFSLTRRHREYKKFNHVHSIPIFKLLKYSRPQSIIRLLQNEDIIHDNLDSNHSRELFF